MTAVRDLGGNAIRVNYAWSFTFRDGTWGISQLLDMSNGSADNHKGAMDATGNAIAIRQKSDGVTINICADRYVAGTGWAAAQLIETTYAGDATYPQIIMNSSGNAIAVWTQSNGTITHIFANQFNWKNRQYRNPNSMTRATCEKGWFHALCLTLVGCAFD